MTTPRRPRWIPCFVAGLLLALAGCEGSPLLPVGGFPGGSNGTAGGTSPTTPGGITPVSGDSTPLEQLMLERINRARLRPAAEASRYGIALDEGVPGQITATSKQPLALNPALTQIARAHSSDMLARDFFAHTNPNGLSPFDRMTNGGYLFQAAGENLAWRGTTGTIDVIATVEEQHKDLFVDAGIEGRGHRVTMMNPVFREVGIGIVRGEFSQNGLTYDSVMVTQDFGTRLSAVTYVTGVVYDDFNQNGQYDYGEGRSNVTITLDGIILTTNSAGGYSIGVQQSGTYTIQFTTGGPTSFPVAGKNIKIDQINGTQVSINLGLGPL